MTKVFISHSSVDKAIARKLRDGLRARGLDPWLDEADLPFGEKIKEAIKTRIADCDHVVALWSERAATSKWVEFEIDAAIELRAVSGKPDVLPIVLSPEIPFPQTLSEYKFLAYRADEHFLVGEVMSRILGTSWGSLLPSPSEIREQTHLVKRGKFLFGPNQCERAIDYDFLMDKFPVSRRKFFSFCFHGGYQNLANYHGRSRLFIETTEQYSQLLMLNPVELISKRFPNFCHEVDKLDYPIHWITAYEAEAYCRWIGGRLPRHIEWEYAARGQDGRLYPWGDSPPEGRCHDGKPGFMQFNCFDYPDGQSPFGIFNMAGHKEEMIGELAADEPSDLADEIITCGWLDYLPDEIRHSVPRYSALGKANCFPIGTAYHPIKFRTVYPVASAFDSIFPLR